MLARFVVKNLFSFKEQAEFNLFPGKASRLGHHKAERKGVEVLKLSALYGANGSGKSNLIKSISLLKELVVSGRIPNALNQQKFKLDPDSQSQSSDLGIEFFYNSHFYYYSVSVLDNVIVDEYFCESSVDEDKMIFHRKTENGKNSIQFFKEFEENQENALMGKVIEQDFLKANEPLFSLLSRISNDAFIDIKYTFAWFRDSLQIIFPHTSVRYFAQQLDVNDEFKQFANDIMCSFHAGIANLGVEKKSIEEFLGNDSQKQLEKIVDELQTDPEKILSLSSGSAGAEDVSVVNEQGKIFAKRLYFEHLNKNGDKIPFHISEESDGTRRLLEYIPVLKLIIGYPVTFVIDEIERSLHPLIIKGILTKFSMDQETKGQLIFSTHESNLLDQDIFRTDEIWFAQKDNIGATKLYSLSDYKEHNTIDIRKGYLNGRYGAVPFLGNLQDLNWEKYDDAKQK